MKTATFWINAHLPISVKYLLNSFKSVCIYVKSWILCLAPGNLFKISSNNQCVKYGARIMGQVCYYSREWPSALHIAGISWILVLETQQHIGIWAISHGRGSFGSFFSWTRFGCILVLDTPVYLNLNNLKSAQLRSLFTLLIKYSRASISTQQTHSRFVLARTRRRREKQKLWNFLILCAISVK